MVHHVFLYFLLIGYFQFFVGVDAEVLLFAVVVVGFLYFIAAEVLLYVVDDFDALIFVVVGGLKFVGFVG